MSHSNIRDVTDYEFEQEYAERYEEPESDCDIDCFDPRDLEFSRFSDDYTDEVDEPVDLYGGDYQDDQPEWMQ